MKFPISGMLSEVMLHMGSAAPGLSPTLLKENRPRLAEPDYICKLTWRPTGYPPHR